jgi:membrane protein
LKALITRPIKIIARSVDGWFGDRCVSSAASIAFFALFSLAPMLILVVTIASYGLKSSNVTQHIFSQLELTVGKVAAQALQETVAKANLSEWSKSATIASLLITLIGASATFTELKAALNNIFLGPSKSTPKFAQATWQFFRARILSGALVLAIGGFMIIAVLAEGIASFFIPRISSNISSHLNPAISDALHPFIAVINLLRFDTFTSIILLASAFTALLVVLPDIKVRWQHAVIGALVGTALFMMGKYAFGFYINAAGTANAFGAAGSAVVTLMWIFYSAAVFLFGAEVLKTLQTEHSSKANNET